MKDIMTGVYTYNNETLNFDFTTNLTASKKITFVNSVVNTIVADNYNSLMRDIMFDHMIIQLFTNVGKFYFNDADEKIDAIEQFLNETDIVDIVKANMEVGLFEELSHSVDLAIEYRTGIHTNPLNESVASLLSTLDKKIKEVDLDGAMQMVQKFASMTGGLTPENIVNAYVNSDFHQKKLDEIAESKKEATEIAEDLDKAIKIVKNESKSKVKSKK